MQRPLFQFSLADMLVAVLIFALSVLLISKLTDEPWLLWTLAALAAFCEMLGILFAHSVFWDTRGTGGTPVACWTTTLGATIGLAASPVIIVTLPGFIVLAVLVGFFLKRKPPPPPPPHDTSE